MSSSNNVVAASLSPSPVVTLQSGITVANFSSPHEFRFTDGSVLPACDPDRAKALMLESLEVATKRSKWSDIQLLFSMSPAVAQAIGELEASPVDVILVPFPVMQSIKDTNRPIGKCRVCRVADRVAKTIHADKFCV